jgi:preprotein translocase subunit SecF
MSDITDVTPETGTPDALGAPEDTSGSIWHRLYHGTTTFDFVGKRRYGFMISGFVIVVSVLSLFTRTLNLGIDFKGGVSWEYSANGTSTSDATKVLGKFSISDGAKVQTLTSAQGTRIRIQVGPLDVAKQTEVRQALATMAKVDIQQVDLSSVSAAWGDEITHKAERALVFFFIALTIYISIRFEWKMAIAAIVAVVHDVLISVGIYSIFGFEVSPATVIAFLTILGYSLYDTIVVFDKVHDNTKRLSTAGKSTYGDIVNLSMNQVLMRSLNTSLAAVLPVLSLLVVGSGIMGAHALQDFALALFVGLITGSYSSIYVATPILAALKEREPRYQAIRQRVGRTSGDINVLRMTGSARPANLGVSAASAGGTTAARPSGSVPPRPRKKKRR